MLYLTFICGWAEVENAVKKQNIATSWDGKSQNTYTAMPVCSLSLTHTQACMYTISLSHTYTKIRKKI